VCSSDLIIFFMRSTPFVSIRRGFVRRFYGYRIAPGCKDAVKVGRRLGEGWEKPCPTLGLKKAEYKMLGRKAKLSA